MSAGQLTEWERKGRSRQFDCYLADEEVAELLRALPPEFGPYQILGVQWDKPHWSVWTSGIDEDPSRYLRRGAFEVRSLVATPRFETEPATALRERASVAGLIQVDHAVVDRDDRWMPTVLVFNPRVRNTTTGEVITHATYVQIFDAMVRNLRPRLIVATRPRGALSHRATDTPRMSLIAYRAWRQGEQFHDVRIDPGGADEDRDKSRA